MNFQESQNLKDFSELYQENPERVIFFVGAGLSMPLFPSWSTFLKELVEKTDTKGKLNFDKAELLDKIDNGLSFLEIADHCADAIGKNEYREIIEKNFDKEFDVKDIPNAYLKLLKIPFKSIITTNYDRIPEIGGQGKLSCYTNQNNSEALKALEKGKKVVLKIHGDILNQESIVLTQKDFNKIIHSNNSIQNSLKSLFSTSTICFIGFGLSDPHFNLILEFLNTINNGQNITHYAFLTSKSKFEIHSLERKYGLKIIEYKASDPTHPEVEQFIDILNGGEIVKKKTISSKPELLEFVENRIQSLLGIYNFSIDLLEKNKKLKINYFTRARTEFEHQKEIVSIFKLFNVSNSLIDTVEISSFVQTEPEIEFIKFSPILLVCKCNFSSVVKFNEGNLSAFEFWKTLTFNQPFSIGNIHFTDRQVNFPFLNF